jgi:hypothetical protein
MVKVVATVTLNLELAVDDVYQLTALERHLQWSYPLLSFLQDLRVNFSYTLQQSVTLHGRGPRLQQ